MLVSENFQKLNRTVVNGNKTHSIFTPPFIATFSSLSSGIHKITAKAIDDQLGEGTTTFPDIKVLLPPPSDFIATGTTGGNSLTWAANPSATSYNVYWSETPSVSKLNGSKTSSAGSSFFHSGIIAGKAYYYVITSISDAGESNDSIECSATPLLAPPVSVFVVPGVDQNTITWSAVSGATGYDIVWASNSASLLASGNRILNVSSPYVHKNIIGSTSYSYGIISKNQYTSSVLSKETTGTPKVGLNGIKTVVSNSQTLALNESGKLQVWGNNSYGQLGDGTFVNKTSSVQVIDQVTSVAAGGYNSVISKSDGYVYYCGNPLENFPSQKSGIRTFSKVSGVSSVTKVAVGDRHILALTVDGLVYAWGENRLYYPGVLGMGDQVDRFSTPTQIPSLESVVDISADSHCSLALKNDGSVWSFGNNSGFMLGFSDLLYDFDTVLTPRKIPGLTGITAIAAGCALKNDGTVWQWGGSLASATPSQVSGLSNVVAISAGGLHKLALTQDSTVWAWGYNNVGQLGNGTKIDNFIPTRVPNLSGVVSIAAGEGYSMVVKNDGTVWSWGQNSSGELGDGTVTSRLSPVQVVFGTGDQ